MRAATRHDPRPGQLWSFCDHDDFTGRDREAWVLVTDSYRVKRDCSEGILLWTPDPRQFSIAMGENGSWSLGGDDCDDGCFDVRWTLVQDVGT